jgi:hypothetical protein
MEIYYEISNIKYQYKEGQAKPPILSYLRTYHKELQNVYQVV